MAGLCAYCDKIPFSEFAAGIRDDVVERENTYALGSVSRVSQSECAFCLLVSEATLLHHQLRPLFVPLDPTDQVRVIWKPSAIAGTRGGFKLSHSPGDVWVAFGSNNNSNMAQMHAYLLPKLPGQSAPFSKAFPGLHVLRFIDTDLKCIVETTEPVQYAALSYVWGAYQTVQLSKANKDALMVPGALHMSKRRDLPRTVSDAMSMAKMLGIRFLWVDSLCLLQNSPDDLERGVNVMDHIYERAWLTIVAAHGHDANAGLPGTHVAERERRDRVRLVKDDLWLGVYANTDMRLERSVYETRAWTFQEHVLSRRILYVFGDQVVFRCRSSEFLEVCEDNLQLPAKRRQGDTPVSTASLLNFPARDFAVMVEEYRKRVLTNESDALRAVAGIIRRVSQKLGFPMLQGLPVGLLDGFILLQGPTAGRRTEFPSYSWLGWRSAHGFHWLSMQHAGRHAWLRDRTWIIWYQRSPTGMITPVWDAALYPHILPQNQDGDVACYGQRHEFKCPVEGIDTSRTIPTRETPFPNANAGKPLLYTYPLLQFWTLSIFLKLQLAPNGEPKGYLIGTEGHYRGWLHLDDFDKTTFLGSSDGLFELILLSEPEGEHWLRRPYGPDHQKLYYAMLIEWQGRVAERRGLGHVHELAVRDSFAPGPVWKEIILG